MRNLMKASMTIDPTYRIAKSTNDCMDRLLSIWEGRYTAVFTSQDMRRRISRASVKM